MDLLRVDAIPLDKKQKAHAAAGEGHALVQGEAHQPSGVGAVHVDEGQQGLHAVLPQAQGGQGLVPLGQGRQQPAVHAQQGHVAPRQQHRAQHHHYGGHDAQGHGGQHRGSGGGVPLPIQQPELRGFAVLAQDAVQIGQQLRSPGAHGQGAVHLQQGRLAADKPVLKPGGLGRVLHLGSL
jgi:hypothetical protein